MRTLIIAVIAATLTGITCYSLGVRRNYQVIQENIHEYQFDIDTSGFDIYQSGRHVGFLKWDTNHTLDSLMMLDNL